MSGQPIFPTALHADVAAAIVEFFQPESMVDAVLLVNSCARGTATPESDVDIAVLIAPDSAPTLRQALFDRWQAVYATAPVFAQFRQAGAFTGVHLDLTTAEYVPETWDDGGGPDGFELVIGNQVVYSLPLYTANDAFAALEKRWLPFYDDALQLERLRMVRAACLYDLDHVPFYVSRKLYFQAFDRLYKAWQEFLQALFIARRTYPIAYNKWIYEQIAQRLALPDLYAQLPPVLQISQLESSELVSKAALLRDLLTTWT